MRREKSERIQIIVKMNHRTDEKLRGGKNMRPRERHSRCGSRSAEARSHKVEVSERQQGDDVCLGVRNHGDSLVCSGLMDVVCGPVGGH